ncbi:hypothetical protein ACH4CE_31470 [Streptomyces gelaticus]|uniref:hypothetical protein n=1 Tax=Streptomyces gelaticus TaxID=285446 RepID=UPI0037B0B17E
MNTHLASIFRKLSADSRIRSTRLALVEGDIEPGDVGWFRAELCARGQGVVRRATTGGAVPNIA